MVQQIPSTLSSEPLATTTRRRYSSSTVVVTGNHDGGSKFIKQPNSNSSIRHRKALSLDATLLLRYHLSHGCLDDDDIVTGNCNGRFSYVKRLWMYLFISSLLPFLPFSTSPFHYDSSHITTLYYSASFQILPLQATAAATIPV